jgi:RNA polymerase sigma-70 factor (ECF subfamily)
MVDKTPANCRQILHRARQAVAQRKQRYVVPDQSAEAVLRQFEEAIGAGDVQALMNILHGDAVLYTDGGGKVQAALNPLYGASNIAKFFAGIARKGALAGIHPVYAEINRQPALLHYVEDEVRNAVVFDIVDGRIRNMFIISNPDKLGALNKEELS